MIEAEVTVNRIQGVDFYRLRIKGHAGFGELGSDIVCSAASILYYALRDSLTDNNIANVSSEKPGEAEIRAYDDHGTGDIRKYFSVAECGFMALSEAYPENVSFVRKNLQG